LPEVIVIESNEKTEDDFIEEDKTAAAAQFTNVIRAWVRLQFDWSLEFPDEEFSSPQPHLGELIAIDVGKIYRKIQTELDPNGVLYGLLPEMARSSVGQIGALNAESYCERSISSANITCTGMAHELIDMLITLKMNRELMEYMATDHMVGLLKEYDKDFRSNPVTITVATAEEDDEDDMAEELEGLPYIPIPLPALEE